MAKHPHMSKYGRALKLLSESGAGIAPGKAYNIDWILGNKTRIRVDVQATSMLLNCTTS